MQWYHYILIGLGSFIIVVFVISYIQAKNASVKLNESEFKKNMRKGQLIDVRTSREYYSGHINGAKNINVATIGKEFGKLRTDKPVYLYCASGKRSARAAIYLKAKGFNEIYELERGLNGWTGSLK